MQPTIVLVRPQEEGNIGSVARAMSNMGLERLLVVEPAPAISGIARGFGVGGWHILETLERRSDLDEAIASFELVIGTSAARQRRLDALPVVTPRQFATELGSIDQRELSCAILFGPEDSGLSSAELDRCSSVISIPCRPEHPTLNLAQAVLIVAYELHLEGRSHSLETRPKASGERAATAAESKLLFERASLALAAIGYDQEHRRQSFLDLLRPLANRSHPTQHELRTLLRICNRVIALGNSPGGESE